MVQDKTCLINISRPTCQHPDKMTPQNPEYATFRDVVDAVERVDDKLDSHKTGVEKRLGRIEKALVLVGALSFVHPQLPLKGVSLLAGALTHIHL